MIRKMSKNCLTKEIPPNTVFGVQYSNLLSTLCVCLLILQDQVSTITAAAHDCEFSKEINKENEEQFPRSVSTTMKLLVVLSALFVLCLQLRGTPGPDHIPGLGNFT